MEPLNKKERTRALFKFLILFIIGILIILIPFYFIIRLPAMERGIKSEEFQKLEDQLNIERKYYAEKIESLKNLFEKFDTPGEDIDKLNADIGFILSDIEHSIGADTSWRANMHRNILNTYLDLKKVKNELGDCKQDLAKCGKELRDAKGAGKPKNSLDPN